MLRQDTDRACYAAQLGRGVLYAPSLESEYCCRRLFFLILPLACDVVLFCACFCN